MTTTKAHFTSGTGHQTMADEIKNPTNRVDRSASGISCNLARTVSVHEWKNVETESDAWEYLARCDAAGKVLE
jgi:hypothetical protein